MYNKMVFLGIFLVAVCAMNLNAQGYGYQDKSVSYGGYDVGYIFNEDRENGYYCLQVYNFRDNSYKKINITKYLKNSYGYTCVKILNTDPDILLCVLQDESTASKKAENRKIELFFLRLFIFNVDDNKIIDSVSFDDGFYASPVINKKKVYVRTNDNYYILQLDDKFRIRSKNPHEGELNISEDFTRENSQYVVNLDNGSFNEVKSTDNDSTLYTFSKNSSAMNYKDMVYVKDNSKNGEYVGKTYADNKESVNRKTEKELVAYDNQFGYYRVYYNP